MFRILNHTDIDFQAWDTCVSNSLNPSLYGKSWYLNILAGNWKGIVKGNYEAVFPLISRQKFGMKYICQPMGIPSVAWYTDSVPDPMDYAMLFNHISSHYHLAEFNFACQPSHSSPESPLLSGLNFRVKQCLDLRNGDFTRLKKRFRRGHKYAIRCAIRHDIRVRRHMDAAMFWKVAETTPVYHRISEYYQNRSCMENLIHTALSNHCGQIWTGYDGEKEVSTAFLIETNGILYLIFLFTHEEGRIKCVNHLLIQEIIRYNCQRLKSLDFGGSNMEKISLFNRGFGTKDHYYMAIKSGKMCRLISKLKAFVW